MPRHLYGKIVGFCFVGNEYTCSLQNYLFMETPLFSDDSSKDAPFTPSQQGAPINDKEVPYMTSMSDCINKLTKAGYLDNFKVTEQGLHSSKEDRYFKPEEVQLINFFRFEGQSDPADNTILYQLETTEGAKGMLVDAYGPYSDAGVNAFMKEVENISKPRAKKFED